MARKIIEISRKNGFENHTKGLEKWGENVLFDESSIL